MDRVEKNLTGENRSRTVAVHSMMTVEKALERHRDDQLNETLPHPTFDEHRRAYANLIDIQRRKIVDILQTGGENIQELDEELEEYGESAIQLAESSRINLNRLRSRLGLPDEPKE
jgi:hypothetical protein